MAGHARLPMPDGTYSLALVPLRIGDAADWLLALRGRGRAARRGDAIAGVTAIAIERTHLLEERKEAEVVRRGAELKSALLASLGHDLKTPLTAVTVAANNLDASWLTDDQRHEQAEIVRAELARLNRLFQDIVDMARIETNAVTAELEWVQPAEIIEAAVRQVEPVIADHTLDIDPGAEQSLVRLDPRLTSAALAHVLENAGQYSPRGLVDHRRCGLDRRELRITVRDRGVGIAANDLDHLFERFYRAARCTRTTVWHRNGARDYARTAGGRGRTSVGRESSRRRRRVHDRRAGRNADQPAFWKRTVCDAPVQILLVDDELSIQRAMAPLLRSRGYT